MQHRSVSVHSALHINFHLWLNAKLHSEIYHLWCNPGKPWRKNENLKPDFSSKLVQIRLFDQNITEKIWLYASKVSLQAFRGTGWRLKFPCQFNWLPLSLVSIWTEWQTECVCRIRSLKDKSINLETEMYQHWKNAGITQTSTEGLVWAAGKRWHKFLSIVLFTGSYKWWGWVCLALPMIFAP